MKRYRYLNGEIVYLHVGTAMPAGTARDQGMPPLEVYQNPSTGELYYRTVENFAERMNEAPPVHWPATLSAQSNMQKEMQKGLSDLQKANHSMTCCETCRNETLAQNPELWSQVTMICCSKCGHKRCPKASNHRFKCTQSNEPNQIGEVDAPLKRSVEMPKPEASNVKVVEIIEDDPSNYLITFIKFIFFIAIIVVVMWWLQ